MKNSQLNVTTTEETSTSEINSNNSSAVTSSSNSPCTNSDKTEEDSSLILVKKCEKTNEINVYIDTNDQRFSNDNEKNASDLKRLVRRISSRQFDRNKLEFSQVENEKIMITSLDDSLEDDGASTKIQPTSSLIQAANNTNTAVSSLSSMSSLSTISSSNSLKHQHNTDIDNVEGTIISPVPSSSSDSSSSYQLSINTNLVVDRKPPLALTPRSNNFKNKIPVLTTTLTAKKNLFEVFYKDLSKEKPLSSFNTASIAKSDNHSRSGSIERSSNNTPTRQSTTNLNQSQNSLHKHVCSIANKCTCEKKFLVDKIGEGKYRIGNSKTIVFIRVSKFRFYDFLIRPTLR